jgi:hypothetical protein
LIKDKISFYYNYNFISACYISFLVYLTQSNFIIDKVIEITKTLIVCLVSYNLFPLLIFVVFSMPEVVIFGFDVVTIMVLVEVLVSGLVVVLVDAVFVVLVGGLVVVLVDALVVVLIDILVVILFTSTITLDFDPFAGANLRVESLLSNSV